VRNGKETTAPKTPWNEGGRQSEAVDRNRRQI